MQDELIKGFLNLGAAGLLGLVFLLVFKGIQKQIDRILDAHKEERGSWQLNDDRNSIISTQAIRDNTEALQALKHAVTQFSHVLDDVECAKYKIIHKTRN